MTLKTLAAATCLTLCTATAGLATTLTSSGTFGEGEIAVFEFTLGSGGTYLDLTTNGSTDVIGGGGADTEIALYFGTGSSATLVPSASNGDDDDGIGLSATLTYGVGSGLVLGDAGNLGPGGSPMAKMARFPQLVFTRSLLVNFQPSSKARLEKLTTLVMNLWIISCRSSVMPR